MYETLLRLLRCFVFVFSSGAACVTAYGQLHTSPDGIVRVETDTSSGSGFVVAAEGSAVEVWTNGHVTGGVGSDARVRFNVGLESEIVATGIVAERRFSGGQDFAKIVAAIHYTGHVFSIGHTDRERDRCLTGGFPLGGRYYGVVLGVERGKSFNGITAYSPPSIPGQSGSPVVNEEGDVVGVVTLRFRDGRQAFGGFLPIEDWTGDSRVSVRDVGGFEVLPNARPVE